MCDLLNGPWLVGSASKALLGGTSSPELPKVVQLLECQRAMSSGAAALVISDKFNYCSATLSPEGDASLRASLRDGQLSDAVGALIKVEAATWRVDVGEDGNSRHPTLQLAIERLQYVSGGEGALHIHGHPRSLLTSEAIRTALSQIVPSADDRVVLTEEVFPSGTEAVTVDWLASDAIPASQQEALERIPFWEVLFGKAQEGEGGPDYFDSLKGSGRWLVEYISW